MIAMSSICCVTYAFPAFLCLLLFSLRVRLPVSCPVWPHSSSRSRVEVGKIAMRVQNAQCTFNLPCFPPSPRSPRLQTEGTHTRNHKRENQQTQNKKNEEKRQVLPVK